MLLLIPIVLFVGASACRQETPIEFVPVGCRVVERIVNGCPSKRIVCQGGRELRSACLQPKDAGPCRAGYSKYFFNPLSRRCEQFSYGGCLGNDNRFDTSYECETICNPENVPEVIKYDESLSADNGVCRQRLQKGISCNTQPPTADWYYDSLEKRCLSFRFLGCGGNDNRFRSKEDCERRCAGGDEDVESSAGGEFICPYDRSGSYAIPNGCRIEWTTGPGVCETPMQVCDEDVENDELSAEESDGTHVCFKPAKKGRCSGSQVRFYFDANAQDCVQFVYSGCESNGNNFASKDTCRSACRGVTDRNYSREDNRYIFASNDNSDCALPAHVGYCFGRHERFYFDTFSRRCVSFQYTGCGGNANNFESELQCERRCDRLGESEEVGRSGQGANDDAPSTFCYLPPEQGPCGDWERRYAHNATSGQCESFWYGGCEGNKNNFRREPDCRSACSNYVASSTTPTDRKQLNRRHWVCDQPAHNGDCFGQFQQWRYDTSSQTCVAFSYTGCGGNKNRFETFDACIDTCTGYRTYFVDTERIGNLPSTLLNDPDYPKEVAEGAAPAIDLKRTSGCLQAPKSGPCKTKTTRWFFDLTTGSCATFTFGGCEENDNNFVSQRECERSCVDEDEPVVIGYISGQLSEELPRICTEPMQPGPCRGRHSKYWFNKVSRRCEAFTYGGCGKNNNHFKTEAECRQTCPYGGRSKRSQTYPRSTPPHCDLRSDYGDQNCQENLRKWYYNSALSKCELFSYGGCGGNLNNFNSWNDCHRECEAEAQIATGRSGSIGRTYGRRFPEKEPPSIGQQATVDRCTLHYDVGYCREGRYPRLTEMETVWYYLAADRECFQTKYSGCGGNENRFTTKDQCERVCRQGDSQPQSHHSKPSYCRDEKKEGYGTAYDTRWYYNDYTNSCAEMIYKGNGGNGNRFSSRYECERMCRR